MGEVVKKKNHCINFLKGCACFGVLYMHTSYDCMISSMISCLSRFAVLIFFMVSGYYCFNNDREVVNSKMPKKVKHIGKLCILSTLLYFVWDGILSKILLGTDIDFMVFIKNCFTPKSIINFIAFNQLPFGGILWFVFALLYCYLIFWVVNKFDWYKVAYISIPVLIIIHIVSRGYVQYNDLIEESVNIIYYRNFIFMGFPFFMLGNYIHKYEDKIVNKFSNKTLILLIVAGLGLSCVERFIVPLELFWGTVIATFCMFVFAVKNPDRKVIPIMATIGEKYSMQVYILQLVVNTFLFSIKKAMGLESNIVLSVLNPVIIFILIPAMVFASQKIWKKFLRLHRQKKVSSDDII